LIFADVEEMRERGAFWQRRLLLQDWEIIYKISRKADFTNKESMAEVVYKQNKKQAVIKVVDPADYDFGEDYPQDHEKSLVHELVHLHLASFDSATEKCRLAERDLEIAVDSLARALVRTLREK
jgi:hypothetical protein